MARLMDYDKDILGSAKARGSVLVAMPNITLKHIRYALVLIYGIITLNTAIAQRYQVADVEYNITGITREYSLSQAVKIDKTRVFDSFEDYAVYYKDIQQQLVNQRVLKSATITESLLDDSGDIIKVKWLITTVDTKNFLMLPYPKYDSNDGFTLKIAARDYNFLGSMQRMRMDATFAIEKDDDEGGYDYVMGVGAGFSIPFKASVFDTVWDNSFSLDHTVGDAHPEFNVSTGLLFKLPFENFDLQLYVREAIVYDDDYEEYGDALYSITTTTLSFPITLAEIPNWNDIKYKPYVTMSFFSDPDGISDDNPDFTGPRFYVGHSLSLGRINWYGNFRQGFEMDIDQKIWYDKQLDILVPLVSVETETHLNWKYLGPSMRTYAFGYSGGGGEKIGTRLRGIADDQKFAIDTDDDPPDIWYLKGAKVLNVRAAIVFNCDLPIKIVQTDWDGWGYSIFKGIIQPVFHCSDHPKLPAFFRGLFFIPKKLFHYCDFELQISPFMDFALTTNEKTGDVFNYKDGFYAGGLEVLLYPSRWRSIQIRASAGADLGRKFLSSKLNTDFRRSTTSKYELYVGLGLFY